MTKEKFNYEGIVERLQAAVGAASLKDLAKKLEVSEPTIHSWRKGKGLDLLKLEKHAETYRIPLAELLFGKPKRVERVRTTGADASALPEAESRLIQKLADDRDEPFDVVHHELLREALFRRGAEQLANFKDLSQRNLQELGLLLNLLISEEKESTETEVEVGTFEGRRFGR